MSSSEAPKTWLSQDAYDRLQAELDQLIANRPAIAAEINARAGHRFARRRSTASGKQKPGIAAGFFMS